MTQHNHLLLPNFDYETDCQDLTNTWNKPKNQNSTYYATILQDCRQMLANSQHILIVHSKKEANCVAHRLSRLAFTTSERYWMEDVSSQLSFDVQHDLGTIFVPDTS